MRVIKHYSPIALFVVLSASLEGPKNGKKSTQVYPEHPSTRGMGVEADDSPSLRFNKQYIALTYYCTYLFLYANMFSHDTMQPYTLVRPVHQGLKYPRIWCEKTEHSHECGTPNL